MHSDPPGIATDYPAMMEAEVGKGKIIWVCAPFENTSLTQPRKVFTSFVKKYVPEMRFASDDTPYVVVVGVVSADFGSAGSGEKTNISVLSEKSLKFV